MDADKDNSNPTILNASDLPSRRQENAVAKREDGGTGLFDDLIPAYSYMNDPFELPTSPSDSSEDDSVEEIDEQEIYGTQIIPTPVPVPPQHRCPGSDILTRARPHLHHMRSRTSSVAWLALCRQPTRHPHHPAVVASLPHQHGCRRSHTDHHSLLTRNSHRSWCTSTSGAGSTTALPCRRAHQEGHAQHR